MNKKAYTLICKNFFTALAFFFVVFLPQNNLIDPNNTEIDGFFLLKELFFRIPAIVLVLLLLEKAKDEGTAKNYPGFSFSPKRDLTALGIALPGLLLIGAAVSLGAAVWGPLPPAVNAPSGWESSLAVLLVCLSVGYLEEAYFRVYLPSQAMGFGRLSALWFPVLLFSLCHLWEGPWGFINALLSSIFLLFIYQKTLSLHGIALAHGLLNMAVFFLANSK